MKRIRIKKVCNTAVWIMLLFLSAFFSGCYPDQPDRVEEYDVTYTNYSTEYDFSIPRTYSLPERVVLVQEDRLRDNDPEFLNDIYADAILEELKTNLDALGWTRVPESESPEIVILPSAFDQTFLYYYNFGYWDWYYPGYFPGWGWYYPGYSPGYISGYRVGTVLVQMTLPSEIEDEQVPVIWVATFNGLLEGSERFISERISRNLDQAFSHPPFNN